MRLLRVLAPLALLAGAIGFSCAAGNEPPPTGAATSGSGGAMGSTTSTHAAATTATTGAVTSASTSSGATTSSSASSTSSSASSTSASSSASTTVSSSASTSASSTSTGCVTYAHTIMIDGVNDFANSETFATTSAGYTGYVAWDQSYLYVGMNGADVGSGSATKWWVVYLSGAGGTTTGVKYNTQQPTLPFPAEYQLQWQATNNLTKALSWSGSAWVDTGWSFSGNVFKSGNYVEMRIARANLGLPTSVSLVMSMVNEQANVEGTYAGVPSTAFTDGYNPSFAHYFNFDLSGCNAPTSFTPM